MARDYYAKNARPSRPVDRSGSSGMVWLLMGVLLGLIIAGVFYLKNQSQQRPVTLPMPIKPTLPQTGPAVTTKQPASTSAASAQNLQTQFDFYDVLPSQKVVGPSGDEDTSDIDNTAQTLPQASTQTQTQVTNEAQNQGQVAGAQTASPAPVQDERQMPNQTQPNVSVTPQNQLPPSPLASPAQPQQQKPKVLVPTQVTPGQEESKISSHKAVSATPKSSLSGLSQKESGISHPVVSHLPAPAIAAEPVSYAVQISTLSSPEAADQLKAQLSLLGFDVHVSSVQKNSKVLQRIWLGPYHSITDAQAIQKQLQENQVTSKVLKNS